jgi:hypothetical protein
MKNDWLRLAPMSMAPDEAIATRRPHLSFAASSVVSFLEFQSKIISPLHYDPTVLSVALCIYPIHTHTYLYNCAVQFLQMTRQNNPESVCRARETSWPQHVA